MITQELADRLGCDVEALNEFAYLVVQEAMKALPIINENLVKRSATLHKMSTEFYDKNSDLAEHKPVVAEIIQRLEAENPGIEFEDLLRRAAPEARNAIELEKQIDSTGGRKMRLSELDDITGML